MRKKAEQEALREKLAKYGTVSCCEASTPATLTTGTAGLPGVLHGRMREKRMREAKLVGKSIAEQMAEEEDTESAAGWIARVRQR